MDKINGMMTGLDFVSTLDTGIKQGLSAAATSSILCPAAGLRSIR